MGITRPPGLRAVIDGDGHLMEDAHLWADYIAPEYREVDPRTLDTDPLPLDRVSSLAQLIHHLLPVPDERGSLLRFHGRPFTSDPQPHVLAARVAEVD